jgi:hypothetical protein
VERVVEKSLNQSSSSKHCSNCKQPRGNTIRENKPKSQKYKSHRQGSPKRKSEDLKYMACKRIGFCKKENQPVPLTKWPVEVQNTAARTDAKL